MRVRGFRWTGGGFVSQTEDESTPRRHRGGKQVGRGVSIYEVEDHMLTAIMGFDNPRWPNRTATIGNMIRVVYELLVDAGKIKPDEAIPIEDFEGYAARWGIGPPGT